MIIVVVGFVPYIRTYVCFVNLFGEVWVIVNTDEWLKKRIRDVTV